MKQQNQQLAEIAKEEASKVIDYDQKPKYFLQINKSACRVLVYVNDIILGYNFVADYGESMLLPVNDFLLKSGTFTYRIEVFPMHNKEYITKDAWVNVKPIYLHHHKAPMNEAQVIGEELELPLYIEEQKLPYYTTSSTFEATLPFDYSERLTKARDLREIPNLEEMVVERYKELQQYIINYDVIGYENEMREYGYQLSDMSYLTEEDIFEAISDRDCFNPNFIDRKVIPIENYRMEIGGHGKLVYLIRSDNMEKVLGIEFYETKEEKKANALWFGRLFIVLYMPEDSGRLKLFYY